MMSAGEGLCARMLRERNFLTTMLIVNFCLFALSCYYNHRVAQKSKPLPTIKNCIKACQWDRFICQI